MRENNNSKEIKTYQERQGWFSDRIGKIIYRNKTSCNCVVCEKVYREGLLIEDLQHSGFVCDCEFSFNVDGHKLRYFDTIEERDEYELLIKDINHMERLNQMIKRIYDTEDEKNN